MKTTIDNLTGTRSHEITGQVSLPRFAAIVTAGLALVLAGCGDREREVSAYDTAEQEEPAVQYQEETVVTMDQPGTAAGTTAPAPESAEATVAYQEEETTLESQQDPGASADVSASGSYAAGAAQEEQAIETEEAQTTTSGTYAAGAQEPQTAEFEAEAELDQEAQAGSESLAASAEPGQQDLEQRIRSDLRTAQALNLSEEELNQIDIQVQQDSVTLAGTVSSQQAAQEIEQRVRQIEEVQSVDNQLQTQDQMQAAE